MQTRQEYDLRERSFKVLHTHFITSLLPNRVPLETDRDTAWLCLTEDEYGLVSLFVGEKNMIFFTKNT